MTKCNGCTVRIPGALQITIPDSEREDTVLCPKCANRFLHDLARWEDINLEEQVKLWLTR